MNAGLSKQIYYKGKHANSIGSIDSKIGAIMGTFLRIKRNCTTNDLFKAALNEKIQELRMIGYSGTTLKNIKYCLLTRHSDPSWKWVEQGVFDMTLMQWINRWMICALKPLKGGVHGIYTLLKHNIRENVNDPHQWLWQPLTHTNRSKVLESTCAS